MTALRDWTHETAEIGDRTLSRSRKATPEECIELARELDILACESVGVDYTIKSLGKDRYRFSGTLEASVAQACVVSLEPVLARISETFSIELGPPEALDDKAPPAGDREILSMPDVEPIEDGRIDVGTMVFGMISAALDPYPRSPDAEFDWVDPKIKAEPEAANPFAALAKLKPKP
ncbi:YceD family protein [Hyphomicrobium sp.]|uniref:YceD family protein n=1 Tax=Hyphomicrobium sp. TaxID=82 RepID=UPI003F71C7C2